MILEWVCIKIISATLTCLKTIFKEIFICNFRYPEIALTVISSLIFDWKGGFGFHKKETSIILLVRRTIAKLAFTLSSYREDTENAAVKSDLLKIHHATLALEK